MVFGVLQRKSRKVFVFIDLPGQHSSPSQSERIKRIMEEKGNLDLISFQRWLVCWCREPFLVRGRLAVKWFFFSLSLYSVFRIHVGKEEPVPAFLEFCFRGSKWMDLHISSEGWVGFFFRDSSSQCALYQVAEHLQYPLKLCKNQLQTWAALEMVRISCRAALEMVRGCSCPAEYRRGRENYRDEQHLSDTFHGLHHHQQASFTAMEVSETCIQSHLYLTTIPHSGKSLALRHREEHKGLG